MSDTGDDFRQRLTEGQIDGPAWREHLRDWRNHPHVTLREHLGMTWDEWGQFITGDGPRWPAGWVDQEGVRE